jgi:hypothetical protein
MLYISSLVDNQYHANIFHVLEQFFTPKEPDEEECYNNGNH